MDTDAKRAVEALAIVCSDGKVDVRDIQPDQLIDQAIEHGVHGLLNEALSRGRVGGVGPAGRQRLHQLGLAAAAADLTQVAAVHELLEALDAVEVRPLLLKGLPVGALHYAKRHLRHRTDVDLYLAPNQAPQTAQVLGSLGYRVCGVRGRDPTVNQFHASRGECTPIPIHFDLHRGISNRALFRSILPFDDVESYAQPVPELHPSARTLSNPHLLIHACVHRIAHGRNTQRTRLVWLNDIRLILAKLDDGERERFVNDALDWKVGAVCADGIESMSAAFRQAPDTILCQALNAQCALEPSASLCRAGRWRWVMSDVASEPGLSARWRYIRQLIVNRIPPDGRR